MSNLRRSKQSASPWYTINNFEKWTKSLRRQRNDDDHEVRSAKSKLVLTAFVNSLIKTHKAELIQADGDQCRMYTHSSLFRALRLCYDLDLKSHMIVSEIIQEILLCEGNLNSIFSVILTSHVTREFPQQTGEVNINTFTLYPNASPRNFNVQVLPAMAYYVKHVAVLEKEISEKETVRPNSRKSLLNQPMPSHHSMTPLMAAAMRKDPELVLLLLSYGADPTLQMETEDGCANMNPIQYIVNCLNSMFSLASWTALRSNYTKNLISLEGEKCQAIFHLFQRCVHHIHLHVSTSLYNDNEITNVYLVHPQFASTIPTSDTPTLQHLCRCSVRRHLLETSSQTLPGAITKLPLPYIMKEYLNLKF